MTEIEIKHNFAKNVKDLRIAKGLNQIQLGELIHYSSKAISKWENEDVLPDIITLNMIAEFFNVTVDDLISPDNVIRKSHRRRNRILITSSSALLPFFIAAITFLVLYLVNIEGAWKAFIVAIPSSSITLIVFTSVWFSKRMRNISIVLTIWGLALTAMMFTNYQEYWWIYLIIASIFTIIAIIFFNIKFGSKSKEKE